MVQKKLLAYVMRYNQQLYKLGVNDCFLLCLRWADLVRGERVRAQYQYIGTRGALQTLTDNNATQCFELLDNHYTRTESPEVGDIVAWQGEHLGACGIYKGDGESWTITQEYGLMTTQDKPKHAWSLING